MKGIVFIGLQGAGKTTFYLQNFFLSHLRLNMDMLKTRHREHLLFQACLESKQPVVIDNTNPDKASREKYICEFKKHKFDVIGYYFSSKLEDCLNRNALRSGKQRVPDVGIRGTYNKMELPNYSEGFDQLYYVTFNDGIFKIEDWNNEI